MQDYIYFFLECGPSVKSDDLKSVYPATAADLLDYKLLRLLILNPSVKQPPGAVSWVSLCLAPQRRGNE